MIDVSKIGVFVGKKADYYAGKWQLAEGSTAPEMSFNKAAFFAGMYWLVYRKLYAALFLLLLVLFADVWLSTFLEDNRIVSHDAVAAWDTISTFIYPSVIGIFGNSWYWRKFSRTCLAAGRESPDPALQESHLRRKGGTNVAGVCVLLAATAGFVVLLLRYG